MKAINSMPRTQTQNSKILINSNKTKLFGFNSHCPCLFDHLVEMLRVAIYAKSIMSQKDKRKESIQLLEHVIGKFVEQEDEILVYYEQILQTVLLYRTKLVSEGVHVKVPTALSKYGLSELLARLRKQFNVADSEHSSSNCPMWLLTSKTRKLPRESQHYTQPTRKKHNSTTSDNETSSSTGSSDTLLSTIPAHFKRLDPFECIPYAGAYCSRNQFEFLFALEFYLRFRFSRKNTPGVEIINEFYEGYTPRKYSFPRSVIEKFRRHLHSHGITLPQSVQTHWHKFRMDSPFIVSGPSGTVRELIDCTRAIFEQYSIPEYDQKIYIYMLNLTEYVDSDDTTAIDLTESVQSNKDEVEVVQENEDQIQKGSQFELSKGMTIQRQPNGNIFTVTEHLLLFALIMDNTIRNKIKTSMVLDVFYNKAKNLKKSYLDYRQEFETIRERLDEAGIDFPSKWSGKTTSSSNFAAKMMKCPINLKMKNAKKMVRSFVRKCAPLELELRAIASIINFPMKDMDKLVALLPSVNTTGNVKEPPIYSPVV